MRKCFQRSFHLSDALLLIAATSPGLVLMRQSGPLEIGWSSPIRFFWTVRNCFYFFSYIVVGWTFLLLLLCLRTPRPPLRRLVRCPGFVATVVSVIVILIRLINCLSVVFVTSLHYNKLLAYGWMVKLFQGLDELKLFPSEVGCAIVAAWSIQAIGGRWRPEPTWCDRLGRILGLYWISTIPFSWFTFWG